MIQQICDTTPPLSLCKQTPLNGFESIHQKVRIIVRRLDWQVLQCRYVRCNKITGTEKGTRDPRGSTALRHRLVMVNTPALAWVWATSMNLERDPFSFTLPPGVSRQRSCLSAVFPTQQLAGPRYPAPSSVLRYPGSTASPSKQLSGFSRSRRT